MSKGLSNPRPLQPQRTQAVQAFATYRSKQVCPTWGLAESFHHFKHAELQWTNSLGISGWGNFFLLLPYFSGRNNPKEAKFHMKLPAKRVKLLLSENCGSQTQTFNKIILWDWYKISGHPFPDSVGLGCPWIFLGNVNCCCSEDCFTTTGSVVWF